jgi:hypothetical protein
MIRLAEAHFGVADVALLVGDDHDRSNPKA